jgi:methylation protein EvaC
MDTLKSCEIFKNNCQISRDKFKKKIINFKNLGKKICGYAASAKSTTLLNYCKIDRNLIEFIVDSTKEKVGKFSPGMHIPVVSENYFHKHLPDLLVLLSWNHKKEILSKEKKYIKNIKIISHTN